MDESHRAEFAEVWGAAMALYGRRAEPAVLGLCFAALRAYELSDIRTALTRHVQDPDSGQYPPKPADVIRHLEGGTESRAMRAWSEVVRAVRHQGSYSSPEFTEPLIAQVLADMGGWIHLCETLMDEEMQFTAREFETRYLGYAVRGHSAPEPKLIGRIEHSEQTFGPPAPDTERLEHDGPRRLEAG